LKNPVLYLHIESNTNKGGGGFGAGQPNKMLEEEAIRCVHSWRAFGGHFKDIDILCLCMTNNPPSDKTIKLLSNKGVKFKHVYDPETDWFPAGWWATPLGGKWIENSTEHDFIIHIDLDMLLLRTLHEEVVRVPEGYLAKCAVYSDGFEDDYQIDPRWKKTFVTCFITSWVENEFYTKWYNLMYWMGVEFKHIFSQEIEGKKPWDPKAWWDYCNLEEHAVDSLHFNHSEPIAKAEKIQIGPSQGYESVGDMTDEELLNVYFLHNHFDNQEEYRRTMKEYARRMVKLGKIKK
jgi:hypothetical protein